MKNFFTITLTLMSGFALLGLLCANGPEQQILSMVIFTLSGMLCSIHLYNVDKK